MAVVSETKLNTLLKESVFGSYLLYGTQSYLIHLYRDMVLKAFLKQFEERVQVQEIEFEDLSYDQLEDHLLSVGFFGVQKAVVVNNFDLNKVVAEDKKRLFALVENLNEDTLLVLSCIPSQKPKTGKGATVAKGFPGTAVLLEKRDKDQVVKFVLAAARREKANLGQAEAKYLIENTSDDMLFLINEVKKLSAYKQEAPITKGDIDLLTPKTVEQRAFDLIDHVLKGNIARALSQLNHLYNLGEETIPIFSAFAAAFTDIYRLKVSKEYRQSETFLTDNFGYKKGDFRLKKASWYVNKISFTQLERICSVLFETDKQLKFTAVDNRLLLEVCFIHIYSIYKERV